MNVCVVYSWDDGGNEAEQDTAIQAEQVHAALQQLGYNTTLAKLDAQSGDLNAILDAHQPTVIFNLVERYNGSDEHAFEFAQQLEKLEIPYTGNSATVLKNTANKLLMKAVFHAHTIPTAPCVSESALAHWIEKDAAHTDSTRYDLATRPLIVKSVSEHASLGIDEQSVVNTPHAAWALIQEKKAQYGGEWFAESFIAGREFNVAILGPNATPTLLPVSEIPFNPAWESTRQIVGYDAKWDPNSSAYQDTTPVYLIDRLRDQQREGRCTQQDEWIQAELVRISLTCWNTLGLNGYARVDFRVDAHGHVYVLEINTNPCIESTAGFMRAANRIGMPFERVIDTIMTGLSNA